MKFNAIALAVVLSAVCFCQATSFAATIIQPTGVTADYQLYPVVNTIAGLGLSSNLFTGDALPGVYPSHDGSEVWTVPFGSPAPTIVFDLGAKYDISGFHIWNYNEPGYTAIGYRNVSISFSNTSAVAGFGSAEVFSGANELSQASGSNSEVGQTKSFAATHAAQWVRFDLISNWGQPNYAAGMSEIRFIGQLFVAPLPAPEPTSFALLGLGMCLIVRRARRRHVAV